MWKEGNKIIFTCKVKETGKLCLSGAGAELVTGKSPSLVSESEDVAQQEVEEDESQDGFGGWFE